MSDLTPETLAEWDAEAEAHVTPDYIDSPHERIRTLIRALRDEKAAREEAEAQRFEWVEIAHVFGQPTTCRAYRDKVLVFDGVDRLALAQAEQERDEAVSLLSGNGRAVLARADAAEARVAELEAGIKALADGYADHAGSGPRHTTMRMVAADLRALTEKGAE